MKRRLLVATPIAHIQGLLEKLEKTFEVEYTPDPDHDQVMAVIDRFSALFVNPNKSKFRIDKEIICAGRNLKCIATASTGTVHIDIPLAMQRGIQVVSLTKELPTIERISSTAELALALTMAALRNLIPAVSSALEGSWDYERFVGRQVDQLTVGVVGYGRLGKKYARYLEALGARVLVCDPYKQSVDVPFELITLAEMIKECDVIALHVHVTSETRNMISRELLEQAKPTLLMVNTSRGEIVDEVAMVEFLNRNSHAKFATDVLANEIEDKWNSPLWAIARERPAQVIISPHIGGMTHDAQFIAYHRAADLLIQSMNSASCGADVVDEGSIGARL